MYTVCNFFKEKLFFFKLEYLKLKNSKLLHTPQDNCTHMGLQEGLGQQTALVGVPLLHGGQEEPSNADVVPGLGKPRRLTPTVHRHAAGDVSNRHLVTLQIIKRDNAYCQRIHIKTFIDLNDYG